jgi:hypothetical protein
MENLKKVMTEQSSLVFDMRDEIIKNRAIDRFVSIKFNEYGIIDYGRMIIEIDGKFEDIGLTDTLLTGLINEELEKEAKLEANLKREEILQKGTLTEDKKIWFNMETAQMFISAFSTLDEDETLPWRDANREVVELSFTQAKAYAKEIRKVLQAFYGLVKA